MPGSADSAGLEARSHTDWSWADGDQAAATPDRCGGRLAVVGGNVGGLAASQQLRFSDVAAAVGGSVVNAAGAARVARRPWCLSCLCARLPPDGSTGDALQPGCR